MSEKQNMNSLRAEKTVLCFQTLAKYSLLTCTDSTQCSVHFKCSEWDADADWGRAVNLLTFIES